MFNRIFILSVLFTLGGCSIFESKSRFDWSHYKEEHPHYFEDYYPKTPELDLKDRNYQLSPELVLDINKMKGYEWITNNVENYPADSDLVKEAIREIEKIPPELRKIISQRVIGWSIVKGLGSSGLSYPLYISADKPFINKGILLLDERTLKAEERNPCIKKESSPYKEGPYQIRCNYSGKRVSAFVMVFLHEVAHIFQDNNKLMSQEYIAISSQDEVKTYPYLRLSWKWDGKEGLTTINPETKNWRTTRRYYDPQPTLENSMMANHFGIWKKSNFPTLYSAMSEAEDWAEGLSYTWIKKHFNTEVSYTLLHKKRVVGSGRLCLFRGTCKEKAKLLKEYADNPKAFELY